MISFQISDLEDTGIRIDQFLVSKLSQYSRSKIQSWIYLGNVLVNGKSCKKRYILELYDQIFINPPPNQLDVQNLNPEPIDLDIVYEDQHIALINKPAGLVVHPGKGNATGTLIHGLLYHFKNLSNINGTIRPGIVHRLDKDTSGLIVIAKTNKAHVYLAEQFKNKKVKKEYCGLTWGIWNENIGIIEKPITRNKKDPTSYTVSETGKPSMTKFSVKKQYHHCSLVSFFPKTGRTHQIRVHTSYYGYPIFGDEKYGGGLSKTKGFLPEFTHFYKRIMNHFNHHALHAFRLEFVHPENKKKVKFEAPLPIDFLNLINSFDLLYEE